MQQQSAPSSGADRAGHAMAMRRFGACSALFGSAFYFAVVAIESLLRPGYDAKTMFISELALGPRGWIQIVNFIVIGLSILVFAISVAMELETSKASQTGVTMLVIIGICLVASGPLVIDPVPASGSFAIDPVAIGPHHMSFHSKFHYVVGSLVFLLAPIAAFCFFLSDRQNSDRAWQVFRRWSLVLTIAMVAGVVLLKVATLPRLGALHDWRGLIQRAMVLPFLVWLFAFGVAMLRRRPAERSQGGDHAAADRATPAPHDMAASLSAET